jgi:hypothetical protein
MVQRRVDDWELRCRFNRGRYNERLQAGELIAKPEPPHAAGAEHGQDAGTISQMVYYLDRTTGQEMASVHQFVRPDGTIGASGVQDPKGLLIGGVRFRRMKGPPENKDPRDLFPWGKWWRSSYREVRRFICRYIGPDADHLFALLTTPLLRVLSSAFNSRGA